MALSWTLDKLGPMARSAEDCATVLRAIEGPDPRDPTSVPIAPMARKSAGRRLRVGILKGKLGGFLSELVERVEHAAARLDLAHAHAAAGSFRDCAHDLTRGEPARARPRLPRGRQASRQAANLSYHK